MRHIGFVFGITSALLLCAAGSCLHAQGAATIHTGDVARSVSVFGAVSHVNTDYGQVGNGFSLGGDYTFNKRFVSPSLEVRYTHGGTTEVNQSAFMAGVKIEKGFGHFHPYLDGMLGYGVINFGNIPGYTHDNSTIYDLGIGMDYRVTRSFSVKVDAQEQYWKLGTGSSELEPYNLSAGIVYQIPFGFRK